MKGKQANTWVRLFSAVRLHLILHYWVIDLEGLGTDISSAVQCFFGTDIYFLPAIATTNKTRCCRVMWFAVYALVHTCTRSNRVSDTYFPSTRSSLTFTPQESKYFPFLHSYHNITQHNNAHSAELGENTGVDQLNGKYKTYGSIKLWLHFSS